MMKDKILGCMIGGAVGDALGYAVEFKKYNGIIAKYGVPGITRYELNHDGVAEFSDDTQMSLYTANGLIINDIKTAYLEWLHTQQYGAQVLDNSKCRISKEPRLYSLRAPGTTCMSALESIAAGRDAVNNSKGCGGIMRVAPIALWGAIHNIDILESVNTAFEAARLTHKNIFGWLPAGMLVYVIQEILQRGVKSCEKLMEIIDNRGVVYERILNPKTRYDVECFDREMLKAIELSCKNIDDVEAIRQLGEGWTGEEAWYISLYCTMKHFDSFEDAVVAAVNHDGDSDSTGAITGNIMGAIHGYSAIPEYYRTNLELRELIESISMEMIESQSN